MSILNAKIVGVKGSNTYFNITGAGFGAVQGTGHAAIDGETLIIDAWSDTAITGHAITANVADITAEFLDSETLADNLDLMFFTAEVNDHAVKFPIRNHGHILDELADLVGLDGKLAASGFPDDVVVDTLHAETSANLGQVTIRGDQSSEGNIKFQNTDRSIQWPGAVPDTFDEVVKYGSPSEGVISVLTLGGMNTNYIRLFAGGKETQITNAGDIELITIGTGVIMKSPNGTRYRLAVADDGTVSAVAVV